MKVKLDGAVADAEGGRDFEDGESFDIEQRHRQALLAWKRCQYRGRVSAVGPLHIRRAGVALQSLDGALLTTLPPVVVAEAIDRDPPDPSDGIFIELHAPPMEVRLDERLLHRVGSGLLIAGDYGERADEARVVRAKERVEAFGTDNFVNGVGFDRLSQRDGPRLHRDDTSKLCTRFGRIGKVSPKKRVKGRRGTPGGAASPRSAVTSEALRHDRYGGGMGEILEVDLLRFEKGSAAQRRAVVDGVRRSLVTGFVYTKHDLGEDMLDTAYGMLQEFFEKPPEVKQSFVAPERHGQTGYTGLLVETAANSDVPDWKEMLNWGVELPFGHPLRTRFPQSYGEQVLPESAVPGITEVLYKFHRQIEDVQVRFLRVIAEGLGCHQSLFDEMTTNGATLTRAIRYPSMEQAPSGTHVWAGAHGDINLITALPRATAPGLQVLVDDDWVDAVAPAGQAIINTGMMLQRLTNGVIPPGIHRVVAAPGYKGERYSVVQFCHPTPWTLLNPLASCISAEHPQRWAGMMSADALDLVLYEINLVEAARRVS